MFLFKEMVNAKMTVLYYSHYIKNIFIYMTALDLSYGMQDLQSCLCMQDLLVAIRKFLVAACGI